MTRTERTALLLALTAVAVRLGFMVVTRFVADDAFITYRYADMLGSGRGFVYNPGEAVLGTTTPLFTLLLSLVRPLSLSIPIFSLCISLIASGLTAVVLYRSALQLRLAEWAVVPAITYALWPRSILADSSGMETAFFTLLLVSAGYWLLRRKVVYAAGLAALATLTRPEGGIYLALLLPGLFLRRDDARWKAMLTAAFPLVCWAVYATITFGSPLPNSIAGKLSLYSGELKTPLMDRLGQIIGSADPLALILTAVALWLIVTGFRWLWQRQRHGEIELGWLGAVVLLYLLATPRIFFWYLAPLYPWLFVFLTAGLLAFLSRAPLGQIARFFRPAYVTGAVVLICIPLLMRSWPYWREQQNIFEHVHRPIGEYLAAHVQPNELVAAEDIGYMGYLSQARILDRDGLVSPVARHYNESGDYGALLVDTHPDWAVIADGYARNDFVQDSVFRASYAEAERFACGAVSYRVYRRK